MPFGHLVESTSHMALSQGPDLLLGTWFSVGVRWSALLADTQADHISLHGHKQWTWTGVGLGVVHRRKGGTGHVCLSFFVSFVGQPTQLAGS